MALSALAYRPTRVIGTVETKPLITASNTLRVSGPQPQW
jgi:hypothetical protein